MYVKWAFGHLVVVSYLVVWTLHDPTDRLTPGFPVLHRLLEFAQTHHRLLPHVPSVCLSTANSSPHVGIAPQSLGSSSQPLRLPGDLRPCPGCVWLRQGLSDSQTSCFTLSLKYFSSDSDNCPHVGIGRLLQCPHLPKEFSVLLTLPFSRLVPSFFRVLRGSIYSFPVVRYSCPLSAGILQTLLCLKVYSWCIYGERCTPCPPTPLPSCSSPAQTHVRWVGDALQLSHPLLPTSPALSFSQLQGLFQWVSSLH